MSNTSNSQGPDIQARDIKRLLMGLYLDYQAGLLSDEQATKQAGLLTAMLKAIETTDLEGKLDTLAALMKGAR
jgi:hypothetical protein